MTSVTTRRQNAVDMESNKLMKQLTNNTKRKPLATLSQNVPISTDDSINTPARKKQKIPIVDYKMEEETKDIEEEERQNEMNIAWLDMCCALLDKKRACEVKLDTPEIQNLMLPNIETPSKRQIEKSIENTKSNTEDVEPRDVDIQIAAKSIHENSQPSSTCCGCKTGCLKLYCRCFLTRGFCTPQCTCASCANTMTSAQRLPAIIAHLKNNINAFRASSISKPPHIKLESNATLSASSRFVHMVPNDHTNAIACRCKKSKCSKKYCDCFQAGVACGPRCQCRDCCNHTSKETNTKQIIYAQDTIKVIVTRTPRRNPLAQKSFHVQL